MVCGFHFTSPSSKGSANCATIAATSAGGRFSEKAIARASLELRLFIFVDSPLNAGFGLSPGSQSAQPGRHGCSSGRCPDRCGLLTSDRRGNGAVCAKRESYLAWVSEFISALPGSPATPLLGARLDRSDPSPPHRPGRRGRCNTCLLYTSDAADDLLCVDLGGRR